MKQLCLLSNFSNYEIEKCNVCVKTKSTKKTYKLVGRETKFLSLIHSDLGDLKQTMTRSGKRYFVTFIDDYSRYTKLYLLSHKDEVSEIFLKYEAEMENQLIRKMTRLRSDRGGKYDSNTLYTTRNLTFTCSYMYR